MDREDCRNRGSKASTLERLGPLLRKSRGEPLVIVTLRRWREESEQVLDELARRFLNCRVVVRSSVSCEDGRTESNAGRFLSVLDVMPGDTGELRRAIDKVVERYPNAAQDDEIFFVQRQVERAEIAGVLFTRTLQGDAPYFVINYSRAGDTTYVTSGRSSESHCVARSAELEELREPWRKIVVAARELESLMDSSRLDIEFAIDESGGVIILQVRPLPPSPRSIVSDEDHRNSLERLSARFLRYSDPLPHMGGSRTILADMSDWNPAEILGARPHSLAYSLYRYLITDSVWHRARTMLGYFDVSPAPLMVALGRKPYIDLRSSFNSLTPADLPHPLRHKLVDFYLDDLERDRSAQDKIEFEIVWSCLDFSCPRAFERLRKHGFTDEEIQTFGESLRILTNSIVNRHEKILAAALRASDTLTHRRRLVLESAEKSGGEPWKLLRAAHVLLDHARTYGTYHFAAAARLAFISRRLFRSLVEESILPPDSFRAFDSSIATVATEFRRDIERFAGGFLGRVDFMTRYGHLRPGTYDITAPRYDQASFFDSPSVTSSAAPGNRFEGFSDREIEAVAAAITERSLEFTVNELIRFHAGATEMRERMKFEFTRNLSDALEFIARAGDSLGIPRSTLADVHLRTLMKYRNPEESEPKVLRTQMENEADLRRKERSRYLDVKLPPVLCSPRDLLEIPSFSVRPNFITRQRVGGRIEILERASASEAAVISGRLLLMESADPGFDWVFARSPAGLITRFGGAASHMAIRCSEFQLPAAIGVGEDVYEILKRSPSATLDCGIEEIVPLLEGVL